MRGFNPRRSPNKQTNKQTNKLRTAALRESRCALARASVFLLAGDKLKKKTCYALSLNLEAFKSIQAIGIRLKDSCRPLSYVALPK